MVPRRAAHVLDVVGADALLAAGGPGGRPGGLAQKHRLKGQHAGDGEQHRGVLWHQGGAGDALVAPGLKKGKEGFTDFGAAAGLGGSNCHGPKYSSAETP